MEEILNQLIDTSTIPMLTALLLGLLTSVSPCTFTTNVMVLAFIGKDVEDGKRSFINGLVYTLGRIVTYTLLGVFCIFIIREGASTFNIQTFVSEYGGYVLGPTLVLFGLFLLFGDKLPLKKFGFHATEHSKQLTGTFGAFVLGLLFALAFCPISGVFYFGMLLPMSAIETGGYLFPTVFAIGSSIIVVLVAWIVSFSISRLGKLYNRVTVIQKRANIVVGIAFVLAGLYYFCVYYLHILTTLE